MHVTNTTALHTLHNVFIELQDRCVSTARECIPLRMISNGKKMKSIHGWNELVKPFQTKCINAHHQWQLNDRPKFDELATSKRVTRLQYCYAIRRLASINKQNDYEFILQSVSASDRKIFWKHVKRMKGGSLYSNISINGFVQHGNITNSFADQF